ncbi:hypothetical protein V1527DRAFT_482002 [Lipomyces starkeyi]
MDRIDSPKCNTTAAGIRGPKTSLLACPLPEESLKLAYSNIMSQSNLLEIVRRPLSPDTMLEVPASRLEYDQVLDILEREEQNIPDCYTMVYEMWLSSKQLPALYMVKWPIFALSNNLPQLPI